jgi:2-polyprenyl-3-methyl-5-hydroxy-6-metoxy-1,4-benzoquinol methylase
MERWPSCHLLYFEIQFISLMLKDFISDPSGFETLENFSHANEFNRWQYEALNKFAGGHTIEIGSGTGNISVFLLKDHYDVTLSDLRPEYCNLLRNKFIDSPHLRGIYELDLSVNNFASEYPGLIAQFDTVIASNVIEHISNDSQAIQNAKALLKNNGKLIILVPSGQWLYNSIDRDLGHFKRYSKSGLRSLLESAGLSVNHTRYFNAAGILGWWFSGSILKAKKVSVAKMNIYNRLIPFFRVLDWFVSPLVGISVISVGVKNERA